MRFSILLCLALLVSGCAEFSKFKVEKDGTYRFRQHPIVVQAPSTCLLDMFVYDSDNSVDFTTGRGYWMASGQYAVEVMPIPEKIKDAKSFIEEIKKIVPKYMAEERASLGLKLQLREERQIDVNGKPAYQAISVDEGKAVLVSTIVLHRKRITAASLVYPLKDQVAAVQQIPWSCYNEFVSAVREAHEPPAKDTRVYQQPQSNFAVIKGTSGGLLGSAIIEAVDGKAVASSENIVHVAPGARRVQISSTCPKIILFIPTYVTETSWVTVETTPGKTYVLKLGTTTDGHSCISRVYEE